MRGCLLLIVALSFAEITSGRRNLVQRSPSVVTSLRGGGGALEVTSSGSLTTAEAARRRQIFGKNALTALPRRSVLDAVLMQFEDRLVQVLVGAAVLSAIGALYERNAAAVGEPLAICFILVLNAVLGGWQVRDLYVRMGDMRLT
jgi:magnesium-transporting ATPase (P-type)